MYKNSEQFKFNFIYIDRYAFGREWVFPGEQIGYGLLRYIISGSAVFNIDGIDYNVSENQLLYIPQNSYITSYALDDKFSFYSIRFVSAVNYDYGDILSEYFNILTISVPKTQELHHHFENIYNYALSDTPMKMFKVRGYFELVIAALIELNITTDKSIDQVANNREPQNTLPRLAFRAKTHLKIDIRIQLVTDYIVLHPTETYTVKKLCDIADLSESQFRKLFKEQTGKTPNNFVTELKITTAARLLLISSLPINEISYSVGFDDVNYFIRVFKNIFGQTPKKYRNSLNM